MSTREGFGKSPRFAGNYADCEPAPTPPDSNLPGWRPCELCEADFEPRSIIEAIGPYGYEICDECTRALLQRKKQGGVAADWPTWEHYQQALRDYPEPMMSSDEFDRAEGWVFTMGVGSG